MRCLESSLRGSKILRVKQKGSYDRNELEMCNQGQIADLVHHFQANRVSFSRNVDCAASRATFA